MKAGLIGKGITESRTPSMHEAEADAQGFDYRYDRFDVGSEPFATMSLADIMTHVEQSGLRGVNITHPFKVEVGALLDELSPQAQDLGAVNTVVFDGGRRIGYNTDYSGFLSAIRASADELPKDEVLLLGAGGAGAAVALALIDAGVQRLSILDRDMARAQALCDQILALRNAAQLTSLSDAAVSGFAFDGVVNATPMGMASHPGMAVDITTFAPVSWVCDIVYFPLETELLRAAKSAGAKPISGQGMAVGQAAASFELFTGHKADAARMAADFTHSQQETAS